MVGGRHHEVAQLVDRDPEVLDLFAVETRPHRGVCSYETHGPQVLRRGRHDQVHAVRALRQRLTNMLVHFVRAFLVGSTAPAK